MWSGGWPEAAEALALALCEAQRPHGAPACKTVSLRLPTEAVADGALAVPEETYAAYVEWRKSGGAGAFAIGPLGDWGRSYDYDSLDAARQKAADWCAYYAYKGTDAFNLRRAFISVPPCRIVAERLP